MNQLTEADILGVARLLSLIPQLQRDVEELKAKSRFWEDLAMAEKWVDRAKTMKMLGMCDVTLRSISIDDKPEPKQDFIRRRYTGKKPFFRMEDIRDYLTGRKGLTGDEATSQIISKK
ncbi:MAG TPA: hypothetical protein VGE24_12685 [Emticicia sp.]